MANEHILAPALYEKMERELSDWKEKAKQESSEDIINGFIPYELVYKEDLLSLFSLSLFSIEMGLIDLEEADYRFLLSLDKPLDWLYIQWLDFDDSHMAMLESFVKTTLAYRRNTEND